MWKLFLLHSSLPEVQVPSLLFCLCFFFFLLCYPGAWVFLAFWESFNEEMNFDLDFEELVKVEVDIVGDKKELLISR